MIRAAEFVRFVVGPDPPFDVGTVGAGELAVGTGAAGFGIDESKPDAPTDKGTSASEPDCASASGAVALGRRVAKKSRGTTVLLIIFKGLVGLPKA